MKKIVLFFIYVLSFISFFQITNAITLEIFKNNSDVIYCQNNECSLEEWTKIVKNDINSIEKQRTLSVYIQDVIKYLLTFISILAVIYIIYAWFKILTSAGDDESVKKSKTTIVSVLIWIVIIWLAYAIVSWLIWVITMS